MPTPHFTAAGWSALPCPAEYGGQDLPSTVAMAVCEIWNSANLAFGLCPLLTQGAIDALHADGSEELKARYLPRMIKGEWTGTMNLTEPQAGSDLAAITTRAERNADGTYRLFGTKIFITYGDHDLADNIVHMVLARIADAPAGTKGISLFLVPKRLVNEDGSLGAMNDVVCAGLEHKLGIHGSPTAVMKFGEKGEGAVGYLIGQENRGLNTMFIMMNAARLAVGIQGVAVAERATQHAVAYAKERKQGRASTDKSAGMSPIIEHPDIRRTILTMKALTQAARAICLVTAREIDISRKAKQGDRAQARRRPRGSSHPDRQGLLHRHRLRGRLHGRADPWRHGLHRGNRRGAVLSRCTHPADLRRHQRHPGHRSRHAQAAAARWLADQGIYLRAGSHRRARSRR